MTMQGFDAGFEDFPDYILKITEEIWENRGLGPSMKRYYHPDVIVRMPGGISTGEPASAAATVATLQEFPDRTLLGEDVIWCGTPEAGMLSSHRILSTATHLGDGSFGRATGNKVVLRAIADCWAKDNMIADEWLVRDNGAIVRQLGVSPEDWARAKIASADPQSLPRPFTPSQDVVGPYTGAGAPGVVGGTYAEMLTRIMDADFATIQGDYDRACHLCLPGGATAHGRPAADAFWIGLRAAFPSARFDVHHVIGRDADPMMPPRAAVRWSLTGTHDGWGAFGAPSGAPVHVMGISHAEYGPRGLRREWVLFDETSIWMQILLHKGG